MISHNLQFILKMNRANQIRQKFQKKISLCEICFLSYDRNLHQPVIICPMHHTICRHCTKLLQSSGLCPFCRETIKFDKIVINNYIYELLPENKPDIIKQDKQSIKPSLEWLAPKLPPKNPPSNQLSIPYKVQKAPKKTSLFNDDDYQDDFVFKVKKKVQKPERKKNLFDEDQEAVNQPNIKPKIQKKAEVKKGLFDEQEEEDGFFKINLKKEKHKQKSKTNLFEQFMVKEEKKSSPVQKQGTSNNKKSLFEDQDEFDFLFRRKSALPAASNPVDKNQKKNLFDDSD